MQDSWAGGDEEQMGMSGGQWDPDEGDAWNSGMSQENNSSCNSWSNGPKKGLQKVQRCPWRDRMNDSLAG
jgi:hypothetical protein